jgi:outer membrane protein OmpA-like peptidoglycan-associated protein
MKGIRLFHSTALVALALLFLAGCSTHQTVSDKVTASEQKQKQSIDQLRQYVDGEFNQLKDATERATRAADNANLAIEDLQNAFFARNDLIERLRDEVYFGFDRYDLDSTARTTLDNIATLASADKNYVVVLEGHTDKVGPASYNYALSERRVASVIRYLIAEKGADRNRLHMTGLGEGYPAADNDSKEGRSQNRRVTIRVLAPR